MSNLRISLNSANERAIEVFWERVRAPDGCLLYYGAKEANGYGYVKNPLPDGPKFIGAHRLAWILKKGPIPEGMKVLHRCDIRACCNVDHLFLGTTSENMVDMMKKRRSAVVKLRPEQVLEIKEALKTPYRGLSRKLAKQYGVKEGVICDIKVGDTFAWLK